MNAEAPADRQRANGYLPRITRRPSFWMGMYVLGIIGGALVYFYFQEEFAISPAVLLLTERERDARAAELIRLVEERYAERGAMIRIERPPVWKLDETRDQPSLVLAYSAPSPRGDDKHANVSGRLVLTASPRIDGLTTIRPYDVEGEKETIGVPFDFRGLERIITKGYESEQISGLGCLYFSVVTMTTLGYGDIVPKSDKARLLILLQVLYGLIVFACFASLLMSDVKETKSHVQRAARE